MPADRAALARLLVATGLLYLWGLGASGWGDTAGTASQIAGWVESTFTAHTVDGITVYDPTSGG